MTTSPSRGALEMDIKSINDAGKFTAVFSVFGNTDLDNERVMPGALDRSVAGLKAKGAPIPVLFGHDGESIIGAIHPSDIRTTKAHAEADGQLDLSKRLAQEAHTMMRSGILTKFSFGYNERVARMGADGVRELHDLDLGEVSVTSRPANPSTELLSVKSEKVYIDAELEGSFEDAIDDVREAAQAALNPSADPNVYVYIEATYPDRALLRVETQGAEEQHYQVTWTADADGNVTLGTPEPVTVDVTVTPAQGKAGRRLSKASEAQLSEIVAHYKQGLEMMNAFLGTAEDAPAGKSDTAEVAPSDAPQVSPEQSNDREPQAKSHTELFERVSEELTYLQLLREKRT